MVVEILDASILEYLKKHNLTVEELYSEKEKKLQQKKQIKRGKKPCIK